MAVLLGATLLTSIVSDAAPRKLDTQSIAVLDILAANHIDFSEFWWRGFGDQSNARHDAGPLPTLSLQNCINFASLICLARHGWP